MAEFSLFIFRRDFRLFDNSALNELAKLNLPILTIFIFDPRQIGDTNAYKSAPAINFMCESLADLEADIKKSGGKLHFGYGQAHEVINSLLPKNKIRAIGWCADYTEFSIMRDQQISEVAKKNNIKIITADDIMLQSNVKKPDNHRYKKFTPYYLTAVKLPVRTCEKFTGKLSGDLYLQAPANLAKFKIPLNIKPAIIGGRTNALKILTNSDKFTDYAKTRNNLFAQTTHLSAYLKFGCVSIREVYYAFAQNPIFIKQLHWRDFYYSLMIDNIDNKQDQFKQQRATPIKWRDILTDGANIWMAWCRGETGFPAVDASMRQLNTTGYMHNRGRLIVSNWLVKIAKINWKEGEKYFAQKLIDYDPAVNNGNWQWSAGTGADSQPYYRIFNPQLQLEKFDSELKYTHEFIPELREYKLAQILADGFTAKNYSKPILDYNAEKNIIISYLKKGGGNINIDDDSDNEIDNNESNNNTESNKNIETNNNTETNKSTINTKYSLRKIATPKVQIGGRGRSRTKSKNSRSRSNSKNKSKSRSRSNSKNSRSRSRTRSNSKNRDKKKSKSKSRSRSNSRNRKKTKSKAKAKKSPFTRKIWTETELNTLANKADIANLPKANIATVIKPQE